MSRYTKQTVDELNKVRQAITEAVESATTSDSLTFAKLSHIELVLEQIAVNLAILADLEAFKLSSSIALKEPITKEDLQAFKLFSSSDLKKPATEAELDSKKEV